MVDKIETEKATEVDHGAKLKVAEADEAAAGDDLTPMQSRDVKTDDIPDPSEAGKGYVASGIDPAHVQQPETEGKEPKGTLPGM